MGFDAHAGCFAQLVQPRAQRVAHCGDVHARERAQVEVQFGRAANAVRVVPRVQAAEVERWNLHREPRVLVLAL